MDAFDKTLPIIACLAALVLIWLALLRDSLQAAEALRQRFLDHATNQPSLDTQHPPTTLATNSPNRTPPVTNHHITSAPSQRIRPAQRR